MDQYIISSRLKQVRNALGKTSLDGLVLTTRANVTYVTAFGGDDSWAVVTQKGVYLLTDSRYTEQARSECVNCRIIERKGPMQKAVAKLVARFKSVETVGVEKATSFGVYQSLKKHVEAKVKPAGQIVEQFRCIKDQKEIAAIQTACKLAEKALARTRRFAKAGITENQLAGRLDFQIRSLGVTNSFDTIVAFGANASRPHHKPTDKKLRKNDTVLVDFGVRYKGYCCDLTRCFTVGKTTGLYKRAYEVVKQAQAAAIERIKPGVDVRRVDAAAREVIKRAKLPVFGHGTGHGLGLEVHELPIVSDKAKGKLQPGMVFTIEPGVYIPGKLGIRLEDDVLVTKTGRKVL